MSAEEGKEHRRRRLRSSGIHSQHDEGLTDPQLHSENERKGEGKIVTNEHKIHFINIDGKP